MPALARWARPPHMARRRRRLESNRQNQVGETTQRTTTAFGPRVWRRSIESWQHPSPGWAQTRRSEEQGDRDSLPSPLRCGVGTHRPNPNPGTPGGVRGPSFQQNRCRRRRRTARRSRAPLLIRRRHCLSTDLQIAIRVCASLRALVPTRFTLFAISAQVNDEAKEEKAFVVSWHAYPSIDLRI